VSSLRSRTYRSGGASASSHAIAVFDEANADDRQLFAGGSAGLLDELRSERSARNAA
jgi:hypothetical protein